MSDPQVRRSRSAAAVPLIAAAVAVVAYAMAPSGRTQTLVGEASVIALNLIAAVSILARGRTEGSWRSTTYLAVLMGMVGLLAATLFVVDFQRRTPEPRSLDVLFLLFLIRVLGAAREEYRGHFPNDSTSGSPRPMPTLIPPRRLAGDLLRDHPTRRRRSDCIVVGRDVRGRVGHALRGVRRPRPPAPRHTRMSSSGSSSRPWQRPPSSSVGNGREVRTTSGSRRCDSFSPRAPWNRARGRHDRAPPSRRQGTRASRG